MTGKAAYDYRTQDCLHTAIRADRADEMVARCRAVRHCPESACYRTPAFPYKACLKYISTAERKIEIYCSMLIVFYIEYFLKY